MRQGISQLLEGDRMIRYGRLGVCGEDAAVVKPLTKGQLVQRPPLVKDRSSLLAF